MSPLSAIYGGSFVVPGQVPRDCEKSYHVPANSRRIPSVS